SHRQVTEKKGVAMRRMFSFLALSFLAGGPVSGLEIVIPGAGDQTQVYIFDKVNPGLANHVGPAGDPCGDGGTSYKLLRIKWSSLPVAIHYDSTTLESIATGATNEARAAFGTWDAEEHPAGAFFTEVASPGAAKVVVKAGVIDGPLGTLAVTSYSYNRLTHS